MEKGTPREDDHQGGQRLDSGLGVVSSENAETGQVLQRTNCKIFKYSHYFRLFKMSKFADVLKVAKVSYVV